SPHVISPPLAASCLRKCALFSSTRARSSRAWSVDIGVLFGTLWIRAATLAPRKSLMMSGRLISASIAIWPSTVRTILFIASLHSVGLLGCRTGCFFPRDHRSGSRIYFAYRGIKLQLSLDQTRQNVASRTLPPIFRAALLNNPQSLPMWPRLGTADRGQRE